MAVFADIPCSPPLARSRPLPATSPAARCSARCSTSDLVVYRGPGRRRRRRPRSLPAPRGAAVTLGCINEGVLQCAYHGWEFGTRRCSSCRVPSALPGVPVPPTGHLPVVPRRRALRAGVGVPRHDPMADVPCIPHDVRPGVPSHQQPGRALDRLGDHGSPTTSWTTPTSRSCTPAPSVEPQDTVVPRFEVASSTTDGRGYSVRGRRQQPRQRPVDLGPVRCGAAPPA